MLTGGFLHFPHVAISDVTETPCQTGILRRWNGLFLTFSELKPTIIIISKAWRDGATSEEK